MRRSSKRTKEAYLEDLPGCAEWQDGDADHQIGDGQAHDEHIRHVPQLAGAVDGQYDQDVTYHHHDIDDRQND